MTTYGAYPRDPHRGGMMPPITFEAANDLVAIAQAVQCADGCDLEVCLEVWREGQWVGTVMHRGFDIPARRGLL